ncbi:hypothetical protein PG988_003482 [Apiospora saccharicola]
MASNKTLISDVCYAGCNDAYLEAQRSGNSSALCRPGSVFQNDVQSFQECLQRTNSSFEDIAALQPYLAYCDTTNAPVLTGATSEETDTPTAEITVIGSMTGRIVTTNVVFSTELGGRSTALTTHVVYPSYFPVPVTTFFTSAATLVDGRPTVYTVSATYFELPRALFSGSTSTATSTSAFGNTTCEL